LQKTEGRRSRQKKTGRTESPEVRRAQLIQATIDSIAKHGMAGTTVKTVSQIAGLSTGIVNFHFQSKKNLFDETLRFLAEEHHDRWKSQLAKYGLTSAEKLLAIADAHFHPEICNIRKLTVWFGFFGECIYRRTYRSLVRDIDSERWQVSVDLCRAIRDEGGYEDIDPKSVVRNLEALYDGYFLNILMYPDVFSCDDAKLRVREFLAQTFPDHFRSFRETMRADMPQLVS
jgi:TetR/AcrR family transcriptional repressor of bet genes